MKTYLIYRFGSDLQKIKAEVFLRDIGADAVARITEVDTDTPERGSDD